MRYFSWKWRTILWELYTLLILCVFFAKSKIFAEARIYFSIGGKHYHRDPVVYKHKEDCIFEDPAYIPIRIPQRVGQYVKIELFWATKWILISEVTFDSRKCKFNGWDYKSRIKWRIWGEVNISLIYLNVHFAHVPELYFF